MFDHSFFKSKLVSTSKLSVSMCMILERKKHFLEDGIRVEHSALVSELLAVLSICSVSVQSIQYSELGPSLPLCGHQVMSHINCLIFY